MRPDRFGQSPLLAFTQSIGYERDHPFGRDISSFPAIVVRVGLLGFYGFKPNDPGPGGVGWGSIFAYVDNLHQGHKLYRKATHTESSSYSTFPGPVPMGSRTLEWEYKRMTAQTGVTTTNSLVTQTFVEGNDWTPDQVTQASGASIAQFVQTDTSRNLGNRKDTVPPDAWNTDSTTVVSKPIDILSWAALLRAKLDTVPDFPGTYSLQLKSDVALPVAEDNPPPDSEDYELVRLQGSNPTATHSSLTFQRNFSYLPLPTDLAGTGVVGTGSNRTGTQLFTSVVSGVVTITMTKVLMRLMDSGGVGYTTFADWTVGNSNIGGPPIGGQIPPIWYEISCGRSAISEVLNPPSVNGSLIGFDLQQSNTFRRFAFPLSPVPGTNLVGNLVPTCSPTYT